MPHNRASSLSQRPQRVSSTPQGTFVNHQTFPLESRRADKGKSQIIRTSTHEVSFVLANARPIALQKNTDFHCIIENFHCIAERLEFPFSIFHFYLFLFFIFRFHFYLFIVWGTPPSVLRRALAHFFPFLFSWRILIHFFLLFQFSKWILTSSLSFSFLMANSRPITLFYFS